MHVDTLSESISDDDRPGRRFKAVHHEKTRQIRSNVATETLTASGNVYASNGAYCFWDIWGYGNGLFMGPQHITTSYDVEDDVLIRSTLDAFYDENEVDTLLNVVEAPQLVTGTQDLYRKIIDARNVGYLSKKNIRQYMTAAKAKGILSFISNGYLYYSFGVAPLIADFRKISRATSTYRKRLDAVIRKAGQEITVHRSCDGTIVGINAGNPLYPLPYDYGTSNDTSKFWTVGHIYDTSKPKKICSIRGIRNHQYQTKSFQTLDNLVSRFGASGPASFLWERIPFSFVVDWFLDLSGVLNSIDNSLTGSTKKVTDACISRKWSCICRIDKLRYATNLTSSVDGTQIANSVLSYYSREVIQPAVSVGLSGRFGKKQISLTAALIGQMAANLKAKR
jgi:hypothetical protein